MFSQRSNNMPPIPDPTTLTTEALRREIATLRELLDVELKGFSDTIMVRMDALDRARSLSLAELERMPGQYGHAIEQLRDVIYATLTVYDEKFKGVALQFEERDVRVLQSAAAATTAVNAALQAAKEAVGEQNKSFTLSIDKSENATMKQIDGQAQSIRIATEGLVSTIGDVKERLTRIEGQQSGVSQNKTSGQTTNSFFVSLAAVAIALVVAIITLTRPSATNPVAPITVPVQPASPQGALPH